MRINSNLNGTKFEKCPPVAAINLASKVQQSIDSKD